MVNRTLTGVHSHFIKRELLSSINELFSQPCVILSRGRVPFHNAMGQADLPPPATRQTTPRTYGQQAGGMHPTGAHTCCVNYSLNNGFYYTKWVNSHLLFGQLLHLLKSSIMGCVYPFYVIIWTDKVTQYFTHNKSQV